MLQPADAERIVFSVLNDAQKQEFEENSQVDFSFGVANLLAVVVLV